MKLLRNCLLLLGALAISAFADSATEPTTFEFSLLPSGAIQGFPGQTIGWGYQIINLDPENYLSLVGLESLQNFTVGSGPLLYDFPAVSPGATLDVPFVLGQSGISFILGDTLGTDTGTIRVMVEWSTEDFSVCDPDCPSPATVIQTEAFAPYSVSNVPEPGTVALAGVSLMVLLAVRRRR